MAETKKMQKKTFAQPDDSRTFDKGQVAIVNLGGMKLGR